MMAATAPPAQAATLPAGFQESVVFSGLQNPTAVRFAPDGRVFVAEKRGVIKVFDSLTDTTPDVFADLNVNVYNFWDRGLLGMTLAPDFSANPYVYILYTYDHELGSTAPAPRWGHPASTPTPARPRPAPPPTAVWSAAACRGCRPAATR
jgi:glucose/arabinose dehydrogenase